MEIPILLLKSSKRNVSGGKKKSLLERLFWSSLKKLLNKLLTLASQSHPKEHERPPAENVWILEEHMGNNTP